MPRNFVQDVGPGDAKPLGMIQRLAQQDAPVICSIVNDGAGAYRGVIPQDCWREPYMTEQELGHEMEAGVAFWGYEIEGELAGVMGLQYVEDVTLIRHAYVYSAHQKRGIGAALLAHLCALARGPVLVGTWAAATWAIRFYEKHSFRLVLPAMKNELLQKYWTVPPRQIETSVVLMLDVEAK